MSNYSKALTSSMTLAQSKQGAHTLALNFFEHFFSVYPETQSYFEGTNIDSFCERKLGIIFEFFIDTVEHPDFAEGKLIEEVIRHQMYGLNDQTYYVTLIDALHEVVRVACGDEWTEDYQNSWHDVGMAFKAHIQAGASVI